MGIKMLARSKLAWRNCHGSNLKIYSGGDGGMLPGAKDQPVFIVVKSSGLE
jgi:hypothetical protein